MVSYYFFKFFSTQVEPLKAVGDLVQNVVQGSSKRVDLLVTGTIGKLIDLLKRRLPYVLALVAAYMLWEYYQGKKYKIYYKENKQNAKIVKELVLPMLQRYKPSIHVPKILRMLMNAFDYDTFEHYHRETVKMPDGEEICLDWYPQDYNDLAPETPIVLLIPGVNSDSRANYCKSYAHMAYEQYGYRVAIFCRRGQSRMPFKVKPHFVTWCNYDDLDATIDHLTNTYVGAPLFLQGISMGACFLQKYCGNVAKEGRKVKAVALGCISSPFSLVKSIQKIHKFPLLDKSITSMMKQGFKEHLHEPLFLQMLKEKGIVAKQVLASKFIDDYNRNYSVILGGYKDVEEYKEASSSYKVVKHISLPTLSINTTNDPIIPVDAVPVTDILQAENFVQILLNSGDHTEYLSGLTLERWVYTLMLEFFNTTHADSTPKVLEQTMC